MSDIAHFDRSALPSTGRLLKATGIAALIAVAVLLVAVLPAEYGIDPTGIGERLGLKSLSAEPAKPAAELGAKPAAEPALALDPALALAPPSRGPVWRSASPYRSDELSLTLRPNEGAEIKALMRKGERFVFTWTTEGGTANFDMHGEAPDAKKDEFTSYWKGTKASGGHGAFEAPFDGTHGWYWRNRGSVPVTVKVRTSGFYEKLYRP